ncbi:MAG: hypothetical protein ACXWT3_07635 [Methylococcaceae bacterium]
MFGFKSKAEKQKEGGFELVKKGRLLLPKIIPSLSEDKYTEFYIFSWGYYEAMLNNFDIDNKTFQDFYLESMLNYANQVEVNKNKYIMAFEEFNNILKSGLDNLESDEEELMQLGADLCSYMDASAFSSFVTRLKTRFAK